MIYEKLASVLVATYALGISSLSLNNENMLDLTKNLENTPVDSEFFSKFEVGCIKKAMPDHFLLNSAIVSEAYPFAGSQ